MKRFKKILSCVPNRRKVVSFTTALTMLLSYIPVNVAGIIVSAVTTATDSTKNFDINGDGEINATDLLVLKKCLLGIESSSTANYDTNDDGNVNILDVLELKNYILPKVHSVIQTDEEYTTLSGNIENISGLESITASAYSEADSTIKNISIITNDDGTWNIDTVPLDIGTNYVTITYVYTDGTTSCEEFTIQRYSTEINLADNVQVFDDDELQNIYDSIIATWNDDMATEDTSDDETNVLVTQDSLLYNMITNGELIEDDIIYIPKCTLFPVGLTLTYKYCDTDYDSSTYGDDLVVINTQQSNIFEIIGDEDVFLDYDNLDVDSVQWFPYQYDDDAINEAFNKLYDDTNSPIRLYDDSADLTDVSNIDGVQLFSDSPMSFTTVGSDDDDNPWHLSELVNSLKLSVNAEKGDTIEETLKNLSISLDVANADFYKYNDSAKLTANVNVTFTDFKPQLAFEQHDNDIKVNQLLCKLDYTRQATAKISGNLSIDFGTLAKDDLLKQAELTAQDNNNNSSNKKPQLNIYGVDLSDKLVLGMLNIDLATGKYKTCSIVKGDTSYTFSPSIFFMVYLDVTGEVSISGYLEMSQTKAETIGFNLQKLDYTNAKYGTYDQLKSKDDTFNYRLDSLGYGLTVYNGGDSEMLSSYVDGELKTSMDLGLGLYFGMGFSLLNTVPVFGRIGVDVNNSIALGGKFKYDMIKYEMVEKEFSGNVSGSVNLTSDLQLKIGFKGIIADQEYSLTVPLLNKELYSWDKSYYKYSGTIVNASTGEPIKNASVTLKSKVNGGDTIVEYTDSNGAFETFVQEGAYSLTVSADGYEDYYAKYLSIAGNSVDNEFSLKAVEVTTTTESTTTEPVVTTTTESVTTTTEPTTTTTSTNTPNIPEDVVATGQCGDDIYYSLDSNGTLTITGTGDMWNYITYNNKLGIKNIIIEEGVTSIGNYTFLNCTSITSVTIPSSVTSIDRYVFNGCTSLESVTIPNSVTSIGWSAFSGCTSLESITIPNSVTSIDRFAFSGCTSLTSATIASATIGVDAFSGCTSLNSLTLEEGVTGISYGAFKNCTSLESIVIPSSVTSIVQFTFNGCTSLTSITIPSSVTYIEIQAFGYCTALTTIYCVAGSYADKYLQKEGYTDKIVYI